MNINLTLITDLYKKTAFFVLILSIISFVLVSFLKSIFNGFSFGIGCFIIFLNILGIYLISKFSEGKTNIEKDRIIFSAFLFIGKLFLIIILIFILIKLHIVEPKFFLGGLSLGFLIFFISNLIILPVKIYKKELKND